MMLLNLIAPRRVAIQYARVLASMIDPAESTKVDRELGKLGRLMGADLKGKELPAEEELSHNAEEFYSSFDLAAWFRTSSDPPVDQQGSGSSNRASEGR